MTSDNQRQTPGDFAPQQGPEQQPHGVPEEPRTGVASPNHAFGQAPQGQFPPIPYPPAQGPPAPYTQPGPGQPLPYGQPGPGQPGALPHPNPMDSASGSKISGLAITSICVLVGIVITTIIFAVITRSALVNFNSVSYRVLMAASGLVMMSIYIVGIVVGASTARQPGRSGKVGAACLGGSALAATMTLVNFVVNATL